MDIEFSDLLKRVKERLWLILLVTGLAAAAAAWVSYNILTPKYQASTTLFVRPEAVSYNNLEAHEALMPTYGEIIKSRRVASTVIRDLKLDITQKKLLKTVKVSGVKNSMVTRISVTHPDKRMAVAIANDFARVFKETLPEFMVVGEIKTIDVAALDFEDKPASPKHLFITAVVLLLVFNTVTGLVILKEVLDKTVKDERSLQELLGLPVLTAFPKLPRKTKSSSGISFMNVPAVAEAFRKLRTNILHMQGERQIKTLLVTSAMPGEGKTLTAVNLAFALAGGGRKVLLVDANLRYPSIHRQFNVSNEKGFTTAVSSPVGSEGVYIIRENLHILPSGPIPRDPSEFLGAQDTVDFLESLKGSYHFILMDGPPVNPVADAQVVSVYIDGVLLVGKIRGTLVEDALRAKNTLEHVGARLVGAAANCQRVKEKDVCVPKNLMTPAAPGPFPGSQPDLT